MRFLQMRNWRWLFYDRWRCNGDRDFWLVIQSLLGEKAGFRFPLTLLILVSLLLKSLVVPSKKLMSRIGIRGARSNFRTRHIDLGFNSSSRNGPQNSLARFPWKNCFTRKPSTNSNLPKGPLVSAVLQSVYGHSKSFLEPMTKRAQVLTFYFGCR